MKNLNHINNQKGDKMKQITDEQIMDVEKLLIQCNIPVQAYIGIQNLFKSLPKIVSEETK
jgi:hypothetical protein